MNKLDFTRVFCLFPLMLFIHAASAGTCPPGTTLNIKTQITQVEVDGYNDKIWFYYADPKKANTEILASVYSGGSYTINSVANILNTSFSFNQNVQLCLRKSGSSANAELLAVFSTL